jgi:hypothetical protein
LTGGTLYLLAKLGGDPTEAPMYVSRTAQNVFNPSRMLWQLLEGLAMLPRALSRLYSGQEFPPLGLLLVPMWVWGAYREFRAGRGLLPWLTIAYVLTLALLGAIHSRYFFPIWPAMALLILLGGVDLAARAIKSRGARVTPRRTILAAIIILGTGTAINAPRTLRNALYYNAAAHTGDYYDVIRDGRHLEVFEAAAAIETLWKPGTTVMTIRDDVRVLHYLTDKRIHPLPGPHEPAPGEQVAAIAEAVATRREPIVVVIDTDDVSPSFREQWARLNGTLRLRKEVQSGRYEIYLRR